MKIDLINPYIIKIIITARKNDSISSIAKRIDLSYGWTHKWIKKLVEKGVFTEKWRGIKLNETNNFYLNVLKFIKENFKDAEFYYSVLDLFGIKYCFTKIDAVYIWTEGRYNISRFRDYYPIFVKIKESDYHLFLEYCKKLNLQVNSRKNVFYVPEILNYFKFYRKSVYPVDSLSDTIKFMKENVYNFEPALEIINEMYSRDIPIKYKEVKYL